MVTWKHIPHMTSPHYEKLLQLDIKLVSEGLRQSQSAPKYNTLHYISFIYKIYLQARTLPLHSNFLKTVADPCELTAKTYCLAQNNFQVGFKFCQRIHKAYRQVCCKEPLSFGWKITSLVSFGFAPFNLHCYGKPLDLDRAQNH